MPASTRSYTKTINGHRVTFTYHPTSKLWTGRILGKSGRASLPGGSGYTYREAEEATRALIRRASPSS